MTKPIIRLALTAGVIATLAACDSSDITGGGVSSPAASAAAPQPSQGSANTGMFAPLESLGAGFAAIFRAGANTEPRDATPADLAPVSFTTDAVEISTT